MHKTRDKAVRMSSLVGCKGGLQGMQLPIERPGVAVNYLISAHVFFDAEPTNSRLIFSRPFFSARTSEFSLLL